MKRLIFCAIVVVLAATAAQSATLGKLKQRLQERRIDLDSSRFPDTVLAGFASQAMSIIATVGKAVQSETTMVVDVNVDRLPLPNRKILVQAAIINANPKDPDSKRQVLSYVSPPEVGKSFAASGDRIQQFTVWNDTIVFDRPSSSGLDTVTVWYYAMPPEVDSLTDTLEIPDTYLPLLVEMVLSMCDERIRLVGPLRDKTEQRLQFYETVLLGRPTDLK